MSVSGKLVTNVFNTDILDPQPLCVILLVFHDPVREALATNHSLSTITDHESFFTGDFEHE
jgi:hypothetical protein